MSVEQYGHGCYHVSRYCKTDPITQRPSGDFLTVGGYDLGPFRDISDAEYRRAAVGHPQNPVFHMRRMFWTGSPWGREIWELARSARPGIPQEPPPCFGCITATRRREHERLATD